MNFLNQNSKDNSTDNNKRCYRMTREEFGKSSEKLAINIKNEFNSEKIKWIIEFSEDIYNLLFDYQSLIRDCDTLKQVRYILEKCLESLNEIGKQSEAMRILVTDVEPICNIYIRKIILHDLNIIYSPIEIDFMEKSIDYLKQKNIENVVNNVLSDMNNNYK